MGVLKRHIASTTKPKIEKNCISQCKDIVDKNSTIGSAGAIDCGDGSVGSAKNPLGLINYHSDIQKYTRTRIKPTILNYSFGQKQVGEFIKKVLENRLWKTEQYWEIHDISPQWANGIDMVIGHDSHREGLSFDLNIPFTNSSFGGSGPFYVHGSFHAVAKNPEAYIRNPFRYDKVSKTINRPGGWVDYDKVIAMVLLGLEAGNTAGFQHGHARIFWGSSKGEFDFISELKKRLIKLQNPHTYKNNGVNGTFFNLFRTHILGPSQSNQKPFNGKLYETAWKVYDMFRPAKGHENHFHIRLTKIKASHQEKDFWSAIQRLKKNGCNPPNIHNWIPHKKSPIEWQKIFKDAH